MLDRSTQAAVTNWHNHLWRRFYVLMLKAAKWKAKDIAVEVGISEGRVSQIRKEYKVSCDYSIIPIVYTNNLNYWQYVRCPPPICRGYFGGSFSASPSDLSLIKTVDRLHQLGALCTATRDRMVQEGRNAENQWFAQIARSVRG